MQDGGPDADFALDRFVRAQDGTWQQALAELRDGHKRSHWMWFVFPQLAGLGHSEMARFYAISGKQEAAAYLRHPVLGPRLAACSEAVLLWAGRRAATEVMGEIDAMKLQSSMTLFEAVAHGNDIFAFVLDAFYGGERDRMTLRLLGD